MSFKLFPFRLFVFILRLIRSFSFLIPVITFGKIRPQKTLAVFFNYSFCPATFDAAWFFMAADLERRRKKCTAMKVVFHQKQYDKNIDWGMAIDESGQKWRFEQLVLSLSQLFPHITDYSVHTEKWRAILALGGSHPVFPKHPLFFNGKPFVEMQVNAMKQLAKTDKPWGLVVSDAAKRYVLEWVAKHAKDKKLIVVTLRSCHLAPKRNSAISEWAKFANNLNKTTYQILFVMDTDTVLKGYPEELKEFPFFDAASWNLGVRAALYELAYLNMMNAIGPMTLCLLNNKCKCLIFKMIVKDEPTASQEVVNRQGYQTNKNPDWATPFQKLVWEEDVYPVIQYEFEKMCQRIENDS